MKVGRAYFVVFPDSLVYVIGYYSDVAPSDLSFIDIAKLPPT